MIIQYKQLTLEDALKTCCDWIIEQQTDDFFRIYELGVPQHEWYMVFYPLRALLLGGKLFREERYLDTAFKYVDRYLMEQLPNGGFTSTYRRQPTKGLTKKQIHDIYLNGNVNIADNGSNITGVIQAASQAAGERREKYIDAARKWLDDWAPIWELPQGGYNNGLWGGELTAGPFTCGTATISSALSAFGKLTGEYEYVQRAERNMRFLCSRWTGDDDGRPRVLNPYLLKKSLAEPALDDFGESFYLIEGMCWTYSASQDDEVRALIRNRLKQWIFGRKGLLSQWATSWFDSLLINYYIDMQNGEPPTHRSGGVQLAWEMAKSNGIIHAFIFYLNNIEEEPRLRDKVEKGLSYLSNPLKCRASGVMCEPEESYGAYALQSTGFAGLSLAEGIRANSVFSVDQAI